MQETILRAQLAQMLDRLPEIDLASADEATPSQPVVEANEQSNNRWGFKFRSKYKDDPKTGSSTMGLQGA